MVHHQVFPFFIYLHSSIHIFLLGRCPVTCIQGFFSLTMVVWDHLTDISSYCWFIPSSAVRPCIVSVPAAAQPRT